MSQESEMLPRVAQRSNSSTIAGIRTISVIEQHEQEEQLVRRAQARDQQAFAQLVQAHQQFVYALALRALRHEGEAEDIAQEAFVRAWLALPRFQIGSSFRTWLYRITVNLCYNRLPGLKRELNTLPAEEAAHVPDERLRDPALTYETEELRAMLYQQITLLSPGYQLLITLRYQQEYSYEEIARIVSIPVSAVKNGLFRARTRLRKALSSYEES